MFLLVPAHPGCPGQNPESRTTLVCVCVCAVIKGGSVIGKQTIGAVLILPGSFC